MNFSDKVKKQKKEEQSMFIDAYKEATQAAIGNKKLFHKKTGPTIRQKSAQVVNAINQITHFYNMPDIEIPAQALEDEDAMDTVLGCTGLTRRRVNLNKGWWRKGEGPVVTKNNTGNVVTLLPRKFGGYRYLDPQTGEYININSKNADVLDDEGYCFYKPFPMKSMSIKNFIYHIFKSFTTFDLIFLAILALAASLLGLVSPQIQQYIYNTVIPEGALKEIYPVAALLIGVLFATTLFGVFQSLWILRVGDKIQFGTQGALWIRLLNLPINFFKKYSSGDLAVRSFRMNAICNSLSSSLIPTMLSAIFSFVYLWQISNLSPVLLLPTVLIIALMLTSSLMRGYYNVQLNKKANELAPKLSGLVYQLFSGVSKIKVAGAEIRAFSKWSKIYSQIAKIKFSPNFFLKIVDAIDAVISLGGTMLIYYIVFKNHLAVADYVAFNAAFGAFSASILKISSIAVEIAYLRPSMELIEPILKEVPESDGNKIRVDKISGKIDINNLKFKYTEDGPWVVNGMNLSIKPGEYLGIVGSTGCGKSTLLRLLLGFEKPEAGAIYFDNQNLSNLDLRSVRKRIGIVLQNGNLFSDSIFANITITNPTATLDDAWEAARKAGCADDIEAMPMGMHTMISEDGGGISGGQRQRIMIARALISDPDLLMFDEATSALDNITQATVVETLEKMDITRVVIAHRLSTIKKCDRIVYLHKGQVVEEGTFDELMQKDGYFAELAKRQLV